MAAATMIESVSPSENALNRSGTDRCSTSVLAHSTAVPAAPAMASGPTATATVGARPAAAKPPPVTSNDPRSRNTMISTGAAKEPNPNAAVAIPKPRSSPPSARR